jgi:hypothetical protein
MSDEEFAALPTRECLCVEGVEVAPEFTNDRDAVTAVRRLCWAHGEFHINDDGVRVRLPVENCPCAGGAA